MNGYIYLLKSKISGKLYLGSTQNINDRIERHNSKRVNSAKHGVPWKVLMIINIEDVKLARQIEYYIKKQKVALSAKAVIFYTNKFLQS